MENIYFKGLNKALDKGCYIKVFTCSLRHPVVRVEKVDKKTSTPKLVSYAENGNVLSALNCASDKIVEEVSSNNETIICDRCNLDDIVENGYTLQFYKLSNDQVLSAICYYSLSYVDKRKEKSINKTNDEINNYTTFANKRTYYPIISVITDDIQSGFEMLDDYLDNINFKEIKESIVDKNLLKRKSN